MHMHIHTHTHIYICTYVLPYFAVSNKFPNPNCSTCISFVSVSMRLSSITLSILAFSLTSVTAFPSIALEAAAIRADAQSKEKRCPYADQHQNEKRAPGFDASAQLIDVSGSHAFVPPNFGSGDLRGPCPGLNALANHNYLPHNGWASLTQFIEATNKGVYPSDQCSCRVAK